MFLAEVAQIASSLAQQIIGPPRQAHCHSCSTYSTQTVACNRQQQRDISHEALEPLAIFCADKEHS
jgi:hypothetical protein